MTDVKPLIVSTGFGWSPADVFLLAAHPDEEMMPNGWEPSRTRRTLVLRCREGQPTVVESLPVPLVRAWFSPGGTAYCGPIKQDFLMVFADGAWKKEVFSTKIEGINHVWGIGGDRPEKDIVYVCTEGSFFVRENGIWSEHAGPGGAQDVFYAHGLSPREVYVCTDKDLLLWDGKSIEAVDGPEGPSPKTLWVVSDTEIVAGAQYASVWTVDEAWRRLPGAYKTFRTLVGLGDTVFAGTPKSGVIQLRPGPPRQVSEPFNCLRLVPLGDGLLAVGKTESFLYDDNGWRRLALPGCRPGEMPTR